MASEYGFAGWISAWPESLLHMTASRVHQFVHDVLFTTDLNDVDENGLRGPPR